MFKLIKEIKSKDGVVHFRRWRILSTPWFKICIHGIYKADEDAHLHNHPWNLLNIVLKGSYCEKTEKADWNPRFPLNMAYRQRDVYHKIEELYTPTVYTLNFMWKFRDTWGYNVDGKHVDHKTYRTMKRNNQI